MALETSEWLVWLGIKSPQASSSTVTGDVSLLQSGFADYAAFQTAVSGDASYTDFETTLQNNGFTGTEATSLSDKAQQNFATWADFQDFVVNQTSSYAEFQAGFSSTSGLVGSTTTQTGEPAAGIRIHDKAGVSYAGVQVPAGTTEVFGSRIEFSQQGASATQQPITYSALTTDDPNNVVTLYTTLTVSCTATNPNSYDVTVTVPYLEDGTVVERKQVTVPASGSTTVSFQVSKSEYVCVDVAIADLTAITACWVPGGLIGI